MRNLICALGFFASFSCLAGITVVGSPSSPDRLIYTKGYSGQGTEIVLTVSLNDGGLQDADMFEATLQNTLNHLTRLSWSSDNADFNTSMPNGLDLQAVLLHEFGHALGLGHPNDGYFTQAGNGPNGVRNAAKGPDQRSGSHDDIRGDDVNYFWFEKGRNNPFELPEVVDGTTMSVNLEDLPNNHTFAANANESVARGYGYGQYASSVMFTPLVNYFTRRLLAADDVATIRLPQAGYDRIANTADDYQVVFRYLGRNQPADIQVSQTTLSGAIGLLSAGYVGLANGDRVFTSYEIFVQKNINWYYDTSPTNSAPDISISSDSGTIYDAGLLKRVIELSGEDAESDAISWSIIEEPLPGSVTIDATAGGSTVLTFEAPTSFASSSEATAVIAATDRLGLQQQLEVVVADAVVEAEPEGEAEDAVVAVLNGAGAIWGWVGLVLLGIWWFRTYKK